MLVNGACRKKLQQNAQATRSSDPLQLLLVPNIPINMPPNKYLLPLFSDPKKFAVT